MIRPPPIPTLFPYTTLFRSTPRPNRSTRNRCGCCSTGRCPYRERRRTSRPGCRSEEHTSELQSLRHLVCRLLLEKKKHYINTCTFTQTTTRVEIAYRYVSDT